MLRHRMLRLALLLALVSLSSARADGPHWQVPDPGPLYDAESDKAKPPAPPAPPAVKPKAAGGLQNYTPHLPDLLKLNDECVKWYTQHCVIKFKDKKQFYHDIVARSAQAMREVDTYCPCPDSYPLWHTEELRELMVKYAQDTWVKCCTDPNMNQEFANHCIAYCIEAYCDTVRFKRTEDLTRRNQALKAKLDELSAKGDLKGGAAFKKAIQAVVVRKVNLKSFVFITGDIPLMVEDGESRMFETLVRMGKALNPALMAAMNNNNNLDVKKALKDVYDLINPPARPVPKR